MNEHIMIPGCLHLAKARYVGRRTNYISSMQLPTSDTTQDIKAVYNVTVKEDSTCEPDLTDKENDVNHTNTHAASKEKDCKETLTRERTVCFELSKDEQIKDSPLKWFGVLVPQSLRSAQTDFQKCIELSVDIANLQLKLQALDLQLA